MADSKISNLTAIPELDNLDLIPVVDSSASETKKITWANIKTGMSISASQVSDFDTEVSNNTDVAANTSARHAAVTVTDSSEIDFTLTGQNITAALIASSIDETKLDLSVNASLALADSASQPGHTHTASEVTDFDTEVANNSAVTANTAKVTNATHTGDATGATALSVVALRGVGLDSSVATPSDGDIMVYRAAGTDWVLEAKPAGGSNPALNDVTDVTITSVADNEILAYDTTSGDWINQTASEAGLATTSDLHSAVTVTDSAEIDFTLTGQNITASIVAGSIDETKLDTSTNASLDLADSASQPGHTHTASEITDLASATVTFTNKTIDANGTGNSITNLEVADFTAASVVTEAEGLASSDNDTSLPTTAAVKDAIDKRSETLILAASDETTALTTGTGKVTFRMPFAMTLTSVRASLTTAGTTSGTTTIDINESGVSVLSTKLTIDFGEKTSTTAATAAVISDSALADDAEITVDVDAITGGATEAGLKIYLIGTRT